MGKRVLHQVVQTVLQGDATSDHVFLIRRWLREMDFSSEIYAATYPEELNSEVHRFWAFRLAKQESVVFHHTIGSDVLDQLSERSIPLVLIYHNITPPKFFVSADFGLTSQLIRGRKQLRRIQPITRLALSDSPYSKTELEETGFKKTGVLPIVLDESRYRTTLDTELVAQFKDGGPLLLFVGRVAPNKKQEDLIKLLHFYRQIEPNARLALVGSLKEEEYVAWLRQFAQDLGLGDAVIFTGHVTQQEMVTYYRMADLFVSMSEHEGFGKPLIESMYLGLPVFAYASTAVPSTLGGAGVLFKRKEYEGLAEIVDMLIRDRQLRLRILNGQRERVQVFLEPHVRQLWQGYLEELQLL